MPSIKDDSTVEAIAREFTSNGRCQEKAMLAIGYSKAYARSGLGQRIYADIRVIAAIKALDGEKQAKYEHNQEISISKLYSDYANLQDKADKGDIQAIQARTAIIRELDHICGLQSTTLHTGQEQVKELSEQERAEAQRYAKFRLLA